MNKEVTDTGKKKFFKKRNKKSDKQGLFSQYVALFKLTKSQEPTFVWWIILGFVATIMLGILAGLFLINMVTAIIVAVPVAFLVSLVILTRKAEKAAYRQIEGQPGASIAVLKNLKRGWNIEENPVAVDPRNQDMLFRLVGKPGVVLVGEGNTYRVRKMFDIERKKVNRIVPNVPVYLVEIGRDEGQVSLPKLIRHIKKQKNKLTKQETYAVSQRMQAIGNSLPIPKGVDPMRVRPDRKATRGR